MSVLLSGVGLVILQYQVKGLLHGYGHGFGFRSDLDPFGKLAKDIYCFLRKVYYTYHVREITLICSETENREILSSTPTCYKLITTTPLHDNSLKKKKKKKSRGS